MVIYYVGDIVLLGSYSISNYYFRYRKARSSMSKEDIRNRKINKILGRKIWI